MARDAFRERVPRSDLLMAVGCPGFQLARTGLFRRGVVEVMDNVSPRPTIVRVAPRRFRDALRITGEITHLDERGVARSRAIDVRLIPHRSVAFLRRSIFVGPRRVHADCPARIHIDEANENARQRAANRDAISSQPLRASPAPDIESMTSPGSPMVQRRAARGIDPSQFSNSQQAV